MKRDRRLTVRTTRKLRCTEFSTDWTRNLAVVNAGTRCIEDGANKTIVAVSFEYDDVLVLVAGYATQRNSPLIFE